ncbi:MAG: YdcH family protein [Lautropia sp.]|nr:YdcH family protein [Lautropia sp.]
MMNDTDRLKLRIAELQLEHRGLDQLIQSLSVIHEVDELALRRMKKRKLQLKDMIVRLQMQLVPDVPA